MNQSQQSFRLVNYQSFEQKCCFCNLRCLKKVLSKSPIVIKMKIQFVGFLPWFKGLGQIEASIGKQFVKHFSACSIFDTTKVLIVD